VDSKAQNPAFGMSRGRPFAAIPREQGRNERDKLSLRPLNNVESPRFVIFRKGARRNEPQRIGESALTPPNSDSLPSDKTHRARPDALA
jgi:hypothetical protein